jgi:hypothetical protein
MVKSCNFVKEFQFLTVNQKFYEQKINVDFCGNPDHRHVRP